MSENNSEKEDIIRKLLLTEEGKKKLIKSMGGKIMCGGLDYINGKPFYRSRGKLYTPEEFRKLNESRNKKDINKGEEMKTVNIKKQQLLEKLEINRDQHKKLVDEAKIGYMKIVKQKLEKLLDAVNRDELVNFTEIYRLSQPVDKTEEYDRAIEMLKMSVDEVVEINNNEFRNYVQDQWDWSDQMLLTNSIYRG